MKQAMASAPPMAAAWLMLGNGCLIASPSCFCIDAITPSCFRAWFRAHKVRAKFPLKFDENVHFLRIRFGPKFKCTRRQVIRDLSRAATASGGVGYEMSIRACLEDHVSPL